MVIIRTRWSQLCPPVQRICRESACPSGGEGCHQPNFVGVIIITMVIMVTFVITVTFVIIMIVNVIPKATNEDEF